MTAGAKVFLRELIGSWYMEVCDWFPTVYFEWLPLFVAYTSHV